MAVRVEHTMSKEILAGYLNAAYFGNESYGIETAAERYFSTSAAKLTLPQAATLAGVVEDPSFYDPLAYPKNALDRRNVVLAHPQHRGQCSRRAKQCTNARSDTTSRGSLHAMMLDMKRIVEVHADPGRASQILATPSTSRCRRDSPARRSTWRSSASCEMSSANGGVERCCAAKIRPAAFPQAGHADRRPSVKLPLTAEARRSAYPVVSSLNYAVEQL
jgi:hypothetical protein